MEKLEFLQEPTPPVRKGLSLGSWVVLIGLVLFAIALGVQLSRQNLIQPRTGETAPDFTLTTFDGETMRLSDLRGQIVVINFWGSWCAPCRAEAPDLQAIHETYAERGVVMIGVNWLDVERDALDFMREFGITYANGPDVGERIANAYRIQGAPENFVIDRNGVVAEAILGMASYEMLANALDRLLASNP